MISSNHRLWLGEGRPENTRYGQVSSEAVVIDVMTIFSDHGSTPSWESSIELSKRSH